jgi:DNA helicase MCM8
MVTAAATDLPISKAKTVSENLKMGAAVLSRFDLIFILVDAPDAERDQLLSEHVIRVRGCC